MRKIRSSLPTRVMIPTVSILSMPDSRDGWPTLQRSVWLSVMESKDKILGSQSYVIDKARLSIRLTAPYSVARRRAASERAKNRGFQT